VRVALRLPDGEGAEATALEGQLLRIVSPRPFAPGEPLRFTASLPGGDVDIEGKSTGSRRRSDAAFDVALRLVNLRREHRERLAAELGA